MSLTGVLLINIGTPDSPSSFAVRRYLNEFLMDPFVIDLPWIVRWPFVHGIITLTRARSSAKLYQKIWTETGSPLLIESKKFSNELGMALGPEYRVAVGMRYGNPSVKSAWSELKSQGIDRLVVFPLYPQY